MIKKFQISKSFIEIIEAQANHSSNEIYGWLIGYSEEDILKVLAIFECFKFEQQTIISAIPNVIEFQEISSILPQGIGPIGIYHSHPNFSEIFHSHTDDSTLLSLTRQFQNCISIVTNGKDTKYYQLKKNNLTKEIKVEFYEPEVSEFLLVSVNEKFKLKLDSKLIDDKKRFTKLFIKAQNLIIDYFQKSWNDFKFTFKQKSISNDSKLKNYLTDNLESIPIILKLPESKKKSSEDFLKIVKDNLDYETLKLENYEMKIRAQFPIYNLRTNNNFGNANQKIKDEFLGNNLIHKLHYSILDKENQRIIIPDDNLIGFFGFYISLLDFNEKDLNEISVSEKNLELQLKMLRFLGSFSNFEVSNRIKVELLKLLNDLERFSTKFTWKDSLKEQFKDLRLKLEQ